MSISRVAVPAGKPVPYVVPSYQGERLNIPGTKSTIRVLASAKETEGAMNVFHMDGVLGDPVGFHHHEEAHDIFICTKGYMKVWAGDQCRLLGPGDMCSVPPKVIHRPQLVGPWNETIGVVTPGKWLDFFRFVSETYSGILADQFDNRDTFQHMMSKFEIIRDQYDVILHPELEAQACEASEWTENDSKIPDGVEKYYLRANTGPKYLMGGVLSRPFITTKQNCGKFAITSIESSNAYSPTFLSNTFSLNKVHQVYSVLDGSIEVTVDGRPNQVLVGESVFIPAGTKMSILFKDRYVRFWAFTSGDGLEALISLGGGPFEGTVIPDKAGPVNTEAVLLAAKKLDITIHAA